MTSVRNKSSSHVVRKAIHDQIIASGYVGESGMVDQFDDDIFVFMLSEYCKYYPELNFTTLLEKKNKSFNMKWNTRSTKTAGCCRITRNSVSVEVSKLVILQLFCKEEEYHLANGVSCSDSLYVTQVIFEHEITHAYMSVVLGLPNENHGSNFVSFASTNFGHTEFRHGLFSGNSLEILRLNEVREGVRDYVRNNVMKGDIVHIRTKSGQEYKCIVNSVRGTKNIQAEILDENNKRTGKGWFSRNPIPYWMVYKIRGTVVPGADGVYMKTETRPNQTLSSGITEEQKELLIRDRIRKTKRLGIGVTVSFVYKGVKEVGIVSSTRGSKNATVTTNDAEFRVPYSLICEIEGDVV